jgi:hypothetical protein
MRVCVCVSTHAQSCRRCLSGYIYTAKSRPKVGNSGSRCTDRKRRCPVWPLPKKRLWLILDWSFQLEAISLAESSCLLIEGPPFCTDVLPRTSWEMSKRRGGEWFWHVSVASRARMEEETSWPANPCSRIFFRVCSRINYCTCFCLPPRDGPGLINALINWRAGRDLARPGLTQRIWLAG